MNAAHVAIAVSSTMFTRPINAAPPKIVPLDTSSPPVLPLALVSIPQLSTQTTAGFGWTMAICFAYAVVGPLWKNNPWTAEYRQERTDPSERPVGWLSGSCLLLRRAAFDEVSGFDERYFMYMEDVDLGDRLGKAGWQNVYVPSAEVLHDKGHATGRDPARNLAAHHRSTYTFLADRYPRPWQAPLRWTMRAALAGRESLVVRNSRRRHAKGRR